MKKLWTAAALLSGLGVRTQGDPTGQSVYLTFDDGPDPTHTAPMLDLLARHEVKATFFLIGRAVQAWPELVQRMVDEGHAIGNHSMGHLRLNAWRPGPEGADIDQAEQLLRRFDGASRHLYRPPHGRVSLATLLACRVRHQRVMLWSMDSLDYKLPPPGVVQHLRARRPTAGDVILMHDDHACACQALEVLLPEWKRAGLRFATLA